MWNKGLNKSHRGFGVLEHESGTRDQQAENTSRPHPRPVVYGYHWKSESRCVRLFLDVVVVVYELCPCCPSRCDIVYAGVVFTVKAEAEAVDNAEKQSRWIWLKTATWKYTTMVNKEGQTQATACIKNMKYTEIEHGRILMVNQIIFWNVLCFFL